MLPRRPKYVPPGRELQLAEILDTALQGGVLLLEGPLGSGKTSLALECAHRLPRADWISCWPRREGLETPSTAPIFVDHIECLDKAAEWLTWCSQHLHDCGVIAISERRLHLPAAARVRRLRLEGPVRVQELAAECQLLSLPLPRRVLSELDWVSELESRFLLTHPQPDWLSLHPDLVRPPTPEQRRMALQKLECVPTEPIGIEVVFQHLAGLERWPEAEEHFQNTHASLQQRGEFARLTRMTGELLAHNPRLALAHFAQAEARAALGQLEPALADLDNVLRWGQDALRLRALAARCHLRLDLGQPLEAETDALAALNNGRAPTSPRQGLQWAVPCSQSAGPGGGGRRMGASGPGPGSAVDRPQRRSLLVLHPGSGAGRARTLAGKPFSLPERPATGPTAGGGAPDPDLPLLDGGRSAATPTPRLGPASD